ncbi:MAG: Lrp/AsnC family transcriptional regulator [Rhodospirillales bacterium]|nr:Lrp/AsnC family transcriptional regulator [Rhodospirillales bacterium]
MQLAADLPSGAKDNGPCWLATLMAPAPQARKFDELDRKLLALLARNARLTQGEIQRELGVTTSRTIRSRLRRLEADGVILGYAARIDERVLGKRVVAFVSVGFRPLHRDATASLQRALRDTPEIRESYVIAGSGDLLLKVSTDSVDSLYRIVLGRLASCEGVNSLRSTLVVGEVAVPDSA